eukprot:TRINITY_DN4180_c0_g1_i1.p1 TRINITY_DN4180_c0_g1~~TRINITY_DN4180_c0_g1_i1.p1  ORF type:complete len:759 (-),score=140.57 TRINITY_DN4180_c0_g1_i1:162-2438(-)
MQTRFEVMLALLLVPSLILTHVLHVSGFSKGHLTFDEDSGEESVAAHVRGGSGQVMAINSDGTMSYEASLADPLSSGRRLSGTAGTGGLKLTTSDSGGKCTKYCLNVKQDKFSWKEMCSTGPKRVVRKCSGCKQCEDMTYSGTCALDCSDFVDMSWKAKCKRPQCTSCSECGTEETTATTTSVATITTTLSSTATLGPSIGSFTAVTGEPFITTLPLVPPLGGSVLVDLEAAPAGLSVNERSRVVTWQPDLSQIGDFLFGVVYRSTEGNEVERRSMRISVAEGSANPAGLYVWPTGGSNSNSGTAASPFASVEHAAQQAQPGDKIYVRGGRYSVKDEIRVQASPAQPVVITRLPGERVRFHPEANKNAFYVPKDSKGIVFRGLEIYGGSERDDHWEILQHTWWQLQDQRVGGKMGFDIDGQHIVVEDCVIHDVSQKAVNVKEGRYVTVRHNVIYNVGHTSISGGHGIMRQWKMNFGDADDPNLFRWDFYGNLLFAVEQRIYSFIPSKGYCHMTIDEGKSILIDETNDDKMKARIAHNVVLFGGVDHIRLKKNPNMQVVNNAVLAEQGRTSPIPDGITAVKKPSIPGLNVSGNLVQTFGGSFAFDVADHFEDEASLSRLSDNYYCGGGRTRTDLPGITDLGVGAAVFRDPAALDFRAAPALPPNVGVGADVLKRLKSLVEDFAVNVVPTGWRHDHVRMVKTIVESAPKEHLSFIGEGPSKKERGKKALWFDVISTEYAKFCSCKQIELIPPHEYWDATA